MREIKIKFELSELSESTKNFTMPLNLPIVQRNGNKLISENFGYEIWIHCYGTNSCQIKLYVISNHTMNLNRLLTILTYYFPNWRLDHIQHRFIYHIQILWSTGFFGQIKHIVLKVWRVEISLKIFWTVYVRALIR